MASYYVWSGATGSANGTSWANAYTTLAAALSGKVAGDVFYVAHDHAESTTGTTLATPSNIATPSKVICVNRSGSVPPVSADRRSTAQVATTGANNITITGCAHYDGIIFSAGTGTSSSCFIILLATNHDWLRFSNCSLRLPINSAGGSQILVGSSSGGIGGTLVDFDNTTFSFGNASANIQICNAMRWRNTPSALLGTIPTTLFTPIAAHGGSLECIGVDLSAAGSGKTLCASGGTAQSFVFNFIDCKLNAAVTKCQVPGGYGSVDVDFVRSGSSGVNYTVFRQRISGTLNEETTIIRTGGASDGTTPISWKIITTGNCSYSMPFDCPPIVIWNDITGASVTATVEGVGAALPTDSDVWLECEYLGDAASPLGSFVNDATADLLTTAANQTSSTETWGGSTAKFKLAVSFTPQQKGWIYARVKIGKPSSTIYIDPLVTLT